MSQHPKLDEAIRRGEIKQCPHCGIYWVPSHITHRCVGMVEAELLPLRTRMDRAREALLLIWPDGGRCQHIHAREAFKELAP